ncbi:Leo1-like protein-domain-containing protein [Auriculariales sp. MPI-PUGE-AT-0066]|nr:Leo1-like protein-domain-containing protein [Auriculariales sp. MPI-PUGE-AT-0066]
MSLADALGSDNTFVEPQQTSYITPGEDAEMEDLFGGDDEVRDAPPTSASPASPAEETEREGSLERQRRHLEYGEDDGEPGDTMEQKIEAEVGIPDIPYPRPSDGNHWILRLPNYLKLDSRPFEKEVYTGPENEEDLRANPDLLRDRSASIRLEVENTMRWRWVRGPDGTMIRESNARVVRWSDGSLSLQLGKELYDLTHNVDASHLKPESGPYAGGGLNYLVAQHKRAMVLQAEAPITGIMSIRPVGMDSEAHRKLVRAVSQKNTRLARIKIDNSLTVPDQPGAGGKKTRSAPRRTPRDPDASPRKRGRQSRLSAAEYTDDDDDEDAGGDDSDDGRVNSSQKRRAPQKKRKPSGADGEDRADDYKADDFVVADSESDDEGGSSRKKKKKNVDYDDVPDELEQMEKQLERQESDRRRAAKGAPKPSTSSTTKPALAPPPPPPPAPAVESDGEEMDIESEEEDEDMPAVSRKGKRKVAFEDDDE